ncbi:hypothetical protein BV20DRAFT_1055978 [Pilatotrama ljubarskyi]|nr:hypothetical protein BV20DRAFT_1055978 [Pilatotrama ljubarskyi]
MLVYDVCYPTHTQAVEIPLAHAGDVVGNLWAVCCELELGRPAPAPACPHPAVVPARLQPAPAGDGGYPCAWDEGWDLLDADLI